MCSRCGGFNRPNDHGFTLVEVMVVASILAFGFVTANKAQVSIFKNRQTVTQGSIATNQAAQQMEQLRNYASVANYSNIASSTGTSTSANADYSQTLTVTNQNRYKKVDLSIAWNDSSNQAQSMELTSYISQNDPQISGLLFNSNYNTSPLPTPGASTGNNPSNTSVITAETSNGTSSTTATTTDVTVPGTNTVLTYDSTGNVTQINNTSAVSLAGTVSLGTGSIAPGRSVSLSSVTLSVSTTNSASAYCSYSSASGGFSCYMAKGWSGSILVGGVSDVKVCAQNAQPYSNLLSSLNDQNYLLIKSSKSCPSSSSHLLQSL